MLRQHAGLLIRDVRVQISVEGPIWDRNLKVKYRTFNPTKKGQYLPVSPYKNTLAQSIEAMLEVEYSTELEIGAGV